MNVIQNNIKKYLDISALPPNEQEEIILRVGALIYQNVLTRSIVIMSNEDQDAFEKLLDKPAEIPEIFQFLKNKIPDFEKIIEEECLIFKEKSSSIMDQIGK